MGAMSDISGPAVIISKERSPRTEINMENVVCQRVPVFASFRESGKTRLPGAGEIYEVKTFSHGLHYADLGAAGETKTLLDFAKLAALPKPVETDVPDLPARETWANVLTLGRERATASRMTPRRCARRLPGIGRCIFRRASIASQIRSRLSRRRFSLACTPSATAIVLTDGTPAFQGVGSPVPVIEAPRGGTNIMTGLGVYTNGVESACGGRQVDGGHALDDERCAAVGRPRHTGYRWHARGDLQQHAHRRHQAGAALGRPVSEPNG